MAIDSSPAIIRFKEIEIFASSNSAFGCVPDWADGARFQRYPTPNFMTSPSGDALSHTLKVEIAAKPRKASEVARLLLMGVYYDFRAVIEIDESQPALELILRNLDCQFVFDDDTGLMKAVCLTGETHNGATAELKTIKPK